VHAEHASEDRYAVPPAVEDRFGDVGAERVVVEYQRTVAKADLVRWRSSGDGQSSGWAAKAEP